MKLCKTSYFFFSIRQLKKERIMLMMTIAKFRLSNRTTTIKENELKPAIITFFSLFIQAILSFLNFPL